MPIEQIVDIAIARKAAFLGGRISGACIKSFDFFLTQFKDATGLIRLRDGLSVSGSSSL